ncbi:reverse transcriptase [Gossypium australe]|uniref:Reverse transcriptase n=1 Tax=Gossypium australe TaxID=47621 RepID=A0A5B6V813_9ROSI|nr:reverse transcriptase [Gossypium australe]
MNAFREALEECELNDLSGTLGKEVDWLEIIFGKDWIEGLINQELWNLFNDYSVQHLQHGLSDHCPVLVDTRGDESLQSNDHHKQFRFNADWLLNKELDEQVKHGWLSNEKETLTKLKELVVHLSKWTKKEKWARERRLKDLNYRMLELSSKEISDEVLVEMTKIKLEMNLEADREELFWEQRARVNWLQICASYRQKNRIQGLENVFRRWVTEVNEFSKIATDYFKDLFASNAVNSSDGLILTMFPCITEELNDSLRKEFQAAEVLEAIKSIVPLKASENDGFLAVFF